MKHLNVIFDSIDDDSHWVTGFVGDGTYKFYSKVEDENKSYGVNKTRVVKLVIRKGEIKDNIAEDEFWSGVVANYDRGWVIKPLNAATTEIFYVVVDELNKIPLYKDRIYNGSKIQKIFSKTKKVLTF
jgi:hypothetical protein